MREHVYQMTEVVGSSKKSIEDAVQNAIDTAGKTTDNLRWFQVGETRGYIEENHVAYWQVTLKIGFTVS
jgi:flavin-binding protein dodecin